MVVRSRPGDLVAEWHIARLLQVDFCDKLEHRVEFYWVLHSFARLRIGEMISPWGNWFGPLTQSFFRYRDDYGLAFRLFGNYWGLVGQPVKSEVRQGWNTEALYAELETFGSPDILWGPGWLFLNPLLSRCLSKTKTMTCTLFFNPLICNQCFLQIFFLKITRFCLGWICTIKGILLNTFGKINSHTYTHTDTPQ